ncbi:hypothetical protein E2562_007677 [Oryza meyeriana var. granulata]|uniref:Secreted protein n=1 Tax=Oryza meyeriana var. granulata TaxID=110450 RepID=A0A6G1EGB0_9ORYZ|nr:hypothetical protein E2562_007677 [Oryza meyeriana var. granulata]
MVMATVISASLLGLSRLAAASLPPCTSLSATRGVLLREAPLLARLAAAASVPFEVLDSTNGPSPRGWAAASGSSMGGSISPLPRSSGM